MRRIVSDETRKKIADFLCQMGFHVKWKEYDNERRRYRICENCGMRHVEVGGKWM